MTLTLFAIISPLKRTWPFNWTNFEFPSPKDNMYQIWLILACWFCRRRFLKMFSVFLFFCYYLPFEKSNPLHLKKLESPFPKDDLFQVWLKLAQWFWRRRLSIYIFVIISPLKRTWLFIWTNLNFLHPRILCIKFNWIWPVGSREVFFF
jgi:hypothetical protein